MEKILRIEDGTFKKAGDTLTDYDGYLIVTDKQTIKLGISNGQSCCEDYGYFMTNDNLEEFKGANIHKIDIVDDCLVKEKAPDIYEGGVMFVNIETDKGTLQFTAYNEHNGYYGHEALVISEQLNHSEGL